MPRLEREFSGSVSFDYKDVGDPEAYLSLFRLKQDAAADDRSVFPVIYLNGRFIDGRDEANLTYKSLSAFVRDALEGPAPAAAAVKGAVPRDIVAYFNRLGPFAVISAGLIDGINPCAFTVIAFFMSYLFMRGYDKKSITLTGFAFILSVFATYLLLGAGLVSSLYSIKGFWRVSSVINTGIGSLSIVLGLLSVYDAIRFGRNASADGMLLKLPKRIKEKMNTVITTEYRTKGKSVAAILAGTVVVGFLVSLLEAVCTGQLYLPTIIFVLKNTSYKAAAFTKLVLYNLAFIIPLIAVYLLALAGVSSGAFSLFMKRHMMLVKIAMAVIFILLGASLVLAEEVEAAAAKPVHFDEKMWPKKNDPNYYDFGDVKEGDVLKHRFYLKNDGKEPLGIARVNTSCACTVPKLGANVVRPGKRVPLTVQFDTTGYPGPRTRYIYVHTDSKTTPVIVFEIHANVVKK
jgi:cytochrome c biogenesis protein CcdA